VQNESHQKLGAAKVPKRALERDNWVQAALCNIAAGERTIWNIKDWDTLLNGLRLTELQVGDWLDLNT